MKKYLFCLFAILPNLLIGQRILKKNQTEYQYEVNPKDTTQKILTSIFVQDSCGNNIEYTEFRFDKFLPFENQLLNKRIKDKGYRQYLYNEKSQPIEVKVLDKNKKLLKKFFYKYDTDGNKIELMIVDTLENQISRHIYQYDSNRDLVNETRFDKKNKIDYVATQQYINGQKKKKVIVDNDNDTAICKYTYYMNGQLIIEEWTEKSSSRKDYHMFFYEGARKVKEIYIDYNGINNCENRMTYYDNDLLKIWIQYDLISGEVIRMIYSEYKFEQ